MFFTIYKITNKINQKTYIGKHQTKKLDDDYFGSGKLLKRAIEKHGKENFIKEILFVFDTEQDMNAKEKELVVINESSYNLCEGGKGGFGYINTHKLNGMRGKKHKPETIAKIKHKRQFQVITNDTKLKLKLKAECRKGKSWYDNTGYKHSPNTLKKMSISHQGSNNNQFGKFWITNGNENRSINGSIPQGFYKGRTIKAKRN